MKKQKGTPSFSESAANLMATFIQFSGDDKKLMKIFVDRLDALLVNATERDHTLKMINQIKSALEDKKEGQKRRRRGANKDSPSAT